MLKGVVHKCPSNRPAVGKKSDNCYEVAEGGRVLQLCKEDLPWQICYLPGKPQSNVWAVSG